MVATELLNIFFLTKLCLCTDTSELSRKDLVTFSCNSVHDNSIMVFNGQWLWRLTAEGLVDGYPVLTRSLYRSAPNTVDGAIYSRQTYYTYLFYG